jgi:hypothetical protein
VHLSSIAHEFANASSNQELITERRLIFISRKGSAQVAETAAASLAVAASHPRWRTAKIKLIVNVVQTVVLLIACRGVSAQSLPSPWINTDIGAPILASAELCKRWV